MLVTSIVSFSHNVSKSFLSQGRKNQGFFGKGLTQFSRLFQLLNLTRMTIINPQKKNSPSMMGLNQQTPDFNSCMLQAELNGISDLKLKHFIFSLKPITYTTIFMVFLFRSS